MTESDDSEGDLDDLCPPDGIGTEGDPDLPLGSDRSVDYSSTSQEETSDDSTDDESDTEVSENEVFIVNCLCFDGLLAELIFIIIIM